MNHDVQALNMARTFTPTSTSLSQARYNRAFNGQVCTALGNHKCTQGIDEALRAADKAIARVTATVTRTSCTKSHID